MSDNDEVQRLLAQLAQQRKIVDMMLTESFEAGAAYQRRLDEIEQLHTFVRAFDAWYESEYACKGELYEALKPARLALGPIPPTAPPHTPRT